MKKLIPLMLVLFILFTLSACTPKYSEEDFIGKTSSEIISEYGKFDCVGMPPCEDGIYRNCSCGYIIKERKVGFLGTSPEILYFISFDENGVAVSCKEGYRPGG